MNNDISVHEPSERVKALRDAAGAVCTSCASGKKPDLLKNFFVRWWHDTFHPCPASPIHDLIAQEIADALTKTFIPESDNTGPFMALQMLAEEARVIYEIMAQDGLPRGKYYTFLETIEKAEKYTIKRWKRDDPGFAERYVAEGMERVKGEAKG